MRAITGKYKGRHFAVPQNFKARPTTDFAKENLFNVLRSYVDFEGLCALDLFGGTGNITLELLSRGAGRVVCVEKDYRHYSFIRSMLHALGDDNGVAVKLDVLRFVPRCREQFGLVFADPPYALPQLSELPALVLESDVLAEEGVFVLEHGKANGFSSHPRFVEHRAYGSVNFSIFR